MGETGLGVRWIRGTRQNSIRRLRAGRMVNGHEGQQNKARRAKTGLDIVRREINEVEKQISSALARRSTGRTGLDEWEVYDSL